VVSLNIGTDAGKLDDELVTTCEPGGCRSGRIVCERIFRGAEQTKERLLVEARYASPVSAARTAAESGCRTF